MIGKIMVVMAAVLGTYVALPMYWPFLRSVAFHLNQIGLQSTLPISYGFLLTVVMFIIASGLSAKA